ncbi:MAG: hypothetical protein SPK06_03260, partial [Kiritimatiellia bacterium]|nr:hypothetical protein [Kiritimatiellia bacterium]
MTHRTPNENFQFQTRWAWVDLDDVVSSERKEFDQALQPRDRTRKASQLQVIGAVKEGNFDPMLLTHSYLSDGGAPIVDGKNQVISGNGRTMMLRSLDEKGRFDKDYSQQVQAWAREQGIALPPEGMKKPVLVQRLLTENAAEIGRIATLSNRHNISGKGEPEVAEEDAAILTPDLMSLFNTGKDGDLLAEENVDFIRTFAERAPDSDT